MTHRLNAVTLLVNDYQEAIDFFVDRLEFLLQDDYELNDGSGNRFVSLSAGPGSGCALLLALPEPGAEGVVGRQGGGWPVGYLLTTDFWGDYDRWRTRGVEFVDFPNEEETGVEVTFRDLYGNLWGLMEIRAETSLEDEQDELLAEPGDLPVGS